MNDTTEPHPDDLGEWVAGNHIIDPVTHPLWCSPARCETSLDGSHTAEPAAIDFDQHGSAFIRLRLWQQRPYIDERGIQHLPPKLIEMVAGNTDSGSVVRPDLTLGQARQLQGLLISTLIAAGDDDSHDSQKATQS